MPILKRVATRLAAVAIATLSLLPSGEPAGPRPFAPGERLTYSVTWSVFDAGEVVATLLKNSAGSEGEDQIVATAHSQGFVSMLYALNDEFKSRLNPDTLCSSGISKRVVEGRRRKQTEIVFDTARQMAVLDERNLAKPAEAPKHGEQSIPA